MLQLAFSVGLRLAGAARRQPSFVQRAQPVEKRVFFNIFAAFFVKFQRAVTLGQQLGAHFCAYLRRLTELVALEKLKTHRLSLEVFE